jgi:hypothetical protein
MLDCESEGYDFINTSETNYDIFQFDWSNVPKIEDFYQNNEINCGKKRGRKSSRNGTYKLHDKKCEDNIIRKIQVHYAKFIRIFINEILKSSGIKDLFFIPLDYNFIKLISQKHRDTLNSKTIKEVFYENNISPKYSTKEKEFNKKICEKIEKEHKDISENILNRNFLFFFDKIYYKNNKKINMKEFGFDDLEVDLKNIELFGDLILKEKDDYSLKEKMDYYAKNCFFQKKEKEIFIIKSAFIKK